MTGPIPSTLKSEQSPEHPLSENNNLQPSDDTGVPSASKKQTASLEIAPETNELVPRNSRKVRTDKPRPFICDICLRGFVRREHLKRHSLAHTQARKFDCVYCGRPFTRRDMVLRHQRTLHWQLFTDVDDKKNKVSDDLQPQQKKARKPKEKAGGDDKKARIPKKKTSADDKKVSLSTNQAVISPITDSNEQDGEENGDEALEMKPRKRARHASFSASSGSTYTFTTPISHGSDLNTFAAPAQNLAPLINDKNTHETHTENNNNNNQQFMLSATSFAPNTTSSLAATPFQQATPQEQDIHYQEALSATETRPHQQVEFSTPQMKAQDMGLLDFLLPDMQLDQDEETGVSEFQTYNIASAVNSSANLHVKYSAEADALNAERLNTVLRNIDSILPPKHFTMEYFHTAQNPEKQNPVSDNHANIPNTSSYLAQQNYPVHQNQSHIEAQLKQTNQHDGDPLLTDKNMKRNKSLLNLNLSQLPLYSTILSPFPEQASGNMFTANHLAQLQYYQTAGDMAVQNAHNKPSEVGKPIHSAGSHLFSPENFNSPSMANFLAYDNHGTASEQFLEKKNYLTQHSQYEIKANSAPVEQTMMDLLQKNSANTQELLEGEAPASWLSDFINNHFEDELKDSNALNTHFNDIGFDENSYANTNLSSSNSYADMHLQSEHAQAHPMIETKPPALQLETNNASANYLPSFTSPLQQLKADSSSTYFAQPPSTQYLQQQQHTRPSNAELVPGLFKQRQMDLWKQFFPHTTSPSDFSSPVVSSTMSETAKLPNSHQPSAIPSPLTKTNVLTPTSSISQHDLSTQAALAVAKAQEKPKAKKASAKPRIGKLKWFDETLRAQIMQMHNLTQFPRVKELNEYINLYQREFHPYFDFIHLQSITPKLENHSILTSVACIGALYAFHSYHSMQLFSISRHNIREMLEDFSDHHKGQDILAPDFNLNISKDYSNKLYESSYYDGGELPLWLIQAMVLLSFVEIFHSSSSINEQVATHLKTMIKLIQIKNLNKPLEKIINPPIDFNNKKGNKLGEENMKEIFDYFITAQSRIRTCHIVLLISNLFTSLVGLDCRMHSVDLKEGGIPCLQEDLFHAASFKEWSKLLRVKYKIKLDSKFTLVELSNGGDDYTHCLRYLSNNALSSMTDGAGNEVTFELDDFHSRRLSHSTLLSMLLSIHEKIFIERSKNYNTIQWELKSKPIIRQLMTTWEHLYLKNGGVFYDASNLDTITQNPKMKLLLPLYNFAKLRKCLNIAPIMKKIWLKNWAKLNEILDDLMFTCCSNDEASAESYNKNLVREASIYCLDTIKLWIETVSFANNSEKSSINTPIFFITCIFSSIVILSVYLQVLEYMATKVALVESDKKFWTQTEIVLQKLENHLSTNKSHIDSTVHSVVKEPLAFSPDFLHNIAEDDVQFNKVVVSTKLSAKCLYLGVRILGDAPVWPASLNFASGLFSRCQHITTPDISSELAQGH
ncbi:hypothetical protein ACO0QE_001804 [Hanseniaspora vineae]